MPSFFRSPKTENLTPDQLAMCIALGTALAAAVILILDRFAPALKASHSPLLRALGVMVLLAAFILPFHYTQRLKRGVQRHAWTGEDLARLRGFVGHPAVRLLCVLFIAIWFALFLGVIFDHWRYAFTAFLPYVVAMNVINLTGALRPPDTHSQTKLTLDAGQPLNSTLWGDRGKI